MDELADMPSCNLSETIHNKWLQQSGNRGSDLYVATVDDYVRAFQQSTNYHAYLKGDQSGTGPHKDELKLRAARRSGNPRTIAEAVSTYSGGDFLNTRIPHLEGEEIFGSSKRKLDLPPGSEHDSHRPDKVNYSFPRMMQTRSTRPRLDNSIHISQCDGENTTGVGVQHVTIVLESACDTSKWHIARCPAKSAKKCFALQSNTRKKCTARIVTGPKGTPAPTYTGMKIAYGSSNRQEIHDFWFCADDIERCVNENKCHYVIDKPEIPTIWPVQIGTKLTREEILSLEEAGFQLEEQKELSPRKLFGGHTTNVMDTINRPKPANPNDYATTRFGKPVRRNMGVPTIDHRNKWESARNVKAQIRNVVEVPYPGLGRIYTIESGIFPKQKEYQVTISNFPACTCPDFINMSAAALGKRGKWVHCKHLYYLFRYLMKVHVVNDNYIHHPTFSYNEVERLLVLSGVRCNEI